MAKILVVDDESSIVEVLSTLLARQGHDVATASNGHFALKLLRSDAFDLLITDMRMPAMGGVELMQAAKKFQTHLAVIVMSAYVEIDQAVAAMREGAFDYVTKPFKIDEIALTVERALSYENAIAENKLLRRSLKNSFHFDYIIGNSQPMLNIYRMIEKIAKTGTTVLITGESGTGKELIARALHESSARSKKTFIKLNCAALPENLLDSELFGYEKGAFTGANSSKKGLFEAADGGTIFLDEIGSIPLKTQVKLLRTLQEKEIRRVGGTKNYKVNVRIIAATNEDLRRKTAIGEFREDLFFRLSVIPIHVPPLRERREDIPLLAEYFLQRFIKENNRKVSMTPAALEAFCEYGWPGNIRQLENLINRVATLNETSEIIVDELPGEMLNNELGLGIVSHNTSSEDACTDEDNIISLKSYLARIEKKYINKVLEISGNDKSLAAKRLDISIASFYRKLNASH